MKKIILTDHAIDRLIKRKISQNLARLTVNNPDYIVNKDKKVEAYKEFKDGLLKVVYTEKEKFIILITAYWVNGDDPKNKI